MKEFLWGLLERGIDTVASIGVVSVMLDVIKELVW